MIVVVVVEERRGVECEGRRCCGASGEEEQLVYHDADFGGRHRKGRNCTPLKDFG